LTLDLDPTPESLMLLALDQARAALAHDEVPIGAVLYHLPTRQIVGQAHNQRILDQDPTAHAELLAIRQGAQTLGDWRLTDTILAVTLEPCPMCAGAIVNARIPQLVYGCHDPKAGAVRTLYQLCSDPRLNHRVQITAGVCADECSALLTSFFAAKRATGKK
jgi:tRNA(adenine34) deaminase